ncbi:DUF1120 domain-containing protein [Burkholderia sp. Ac-20344]|uniref:DUF1120 domain-containing protein n=1 Tax=Burkholderia sp. Ac-20344 TaxID=2703890 RepID=UPI00197BEA9A|nr:DUF1120 domain-containing protein [Burkholderia sp. Ac-20344]MBN3836265.1 DUF1120 domain-containing protein [Burkholderia sp. Ac-20344]
MQYYLIRLTTLGVLTVVSQSVFASAPPTAELKVTGQIVPAACTVKLANNIDYGNIIAASLKTDKTNPLNEKDVGLTINCDANAKLALSVLDNHAGTASTGLGTDNTILGVAGLPDADFFGLNLSGGRNIGGYAVALKSVTVDSVATDVLGSPDKTTWTKSADGLLDPTGTKVVSWGASGTSTPLAGKAVAGTVAVQAVIDKGSNLDLNNPINLDGSATLTVSYL